MLKQSTNRWKPLENIYIQGEGILLCGVELSLKTTVGVAGNCGAAQLIYHIQSQSITSQSLHEATTETSIVSVISETLGYCGLGCILPRTM